MPTLYHHFEIDVDQYNITRLGAILAADNPGLMHIESVAFIRTSTVVASELTKHEQDEALQTVRLTLLAIPRDRLESFS